MGPTSSGLWPTAMDVNGCNDYVNGIHNMQEKGAFAPTTASETTAGSHQHNTVTADHEPQSQAQQQVGPNGSIAPPSSANFGFLNGLLGFDVNGQETQRRDGSM